MAGSEKKIGNTLTENHGLIPYGAKSRVHSRRTAAFKSITDIAKKLALRWMYYF
jgi:hypothetical protein